jgi:hypothetical protein
MHMVPVHAIALSCRSAATFPALGNDAGRQRIVAMTGAARDRHAVITHTPVSTSRCGPHLCLDPAPDAFNRTDVITGRSAPSTRRLRCESGFTATFSRCHQARVVGVVVVMLTG